MDEKIASFQDFPLPDLNPLLKIYPYTKAADGKPQWIIINPAAGTNYKIGWIEFECLARFHQCKTAQELIDRVGAETPLTIKGEDLQALLSFLSQAGLMSSSGHDTKPPEPDQTPLWKKAVHKYLFFTLPLFRPQKFLDAAYPLVRPLFSKGFWVFTLLLMLMGILLTIPRAEEFFSTFAQLFSLEGFLLIGIVFTGIKIIHEFAHAFMARHYGVSVPHMGLAFMVMYPVFYTEMTGSWRVPSPKARMEMGMAGVMSEITLAAFFLIFWHLTDDPYAQNLAFSVVTLSLAGSLLVNLNPFMRFDGYYVLSDYLGIENLHSAALAHARHLWRSKIFGLKEQLPEEHQRYKKFLTLFGLGVLIYRFFLFIGIALLVYFVFGAVVDN